MMEGMRSAATSQDAVARANERLRGTFAGVLGMRFSLLTPDRVEAELDVRADLKQPWGILHGGAVMALADTVAGAGAFMNVAPGQESVTVELKINLIRSVREGTIRATAIPLHRGQSTSIWETRVTDDLGQLVAATLSTHYVLSRPSA
jgi:1,4-dihydroxy-2-naphthoyl-CoA hydrolase